MLSSEAKTRLNTNVLPWDEWQKKYSLEQNHNTTLGLLVNSFDTYFMIEVKNSEHKLYFVVKIVTTFFGCPK